MKIYLVNGYKEKDGSGCYAEIESNFTLGVYSTIKKAERVANYLKNKSYGDYDGFEIIERIVR